MVVDKVHTRVEVMCGLCGALLRTKVENGKRSVLEQGWW